MVKAYILGGVVRQDGSGGGQVTSVILCLVSAMLAVQLLVSALAIALRKRKLQDMAEASGVKILWLFWIMLWSFLLSGICLAVAAVLAVKSPAIAIILYVPSGILATAALLGRRSRSKRDPTL